MQRYLEYHLYYAVQRRLQRMKQTNMKNIQKKNDFGQNLFIVAYVSQGFRTHICIVYK